jgi:hypothetical protein
MKRHMAARFRPSAALVLLALAGCGSCGEPADAPAPGAAGAASPAGRASAFADGPGTVRCLELPGAQREGLFADGTRIELAERSDPRDGAGVRRVAVDLGTGDAARLGEAERPPRPFGRGRVLLLRSPESAASDGPALFVDGPDGSAPVRISRAGHVVDSFAGDEPRGVAYYTAGKRLWRAPVAGGEVAEVADNVLAVWAVVDGGVAALVRGALGPKSETQLVPLGGGVRSSVAGDPERLAVFADRLLVTGENGREPPRQMRFSGGSLAVIEGLAEGDTLLAGGGGPDVFFARTEGPVSTLLVFDGGATAAPRGRWRASPGGGSAKRCVSVTGASAPSSRKIRTTAAPAPPTTRPTSACLAAAPESRCPSRRGAPRRGSRRCGRGSRPSSTRWGRTRRPASSTPAR